MIFSHKIWLFYWHINKVILIFCWLLYSLGVLFFRASSIDYVYWHLHYFIYIILELERDEKQIESRWVNRELWNWKTNSLSDKYCLEKPLNCFFFSEYLFFLNGIFSQRFQERKSHFARAPRIHSSTLASRSSWRSPSIGSSRANRFPLSGVLSKRVRKNSPTTVFFIPFLPILFYCFLDS